MSLITPWTESAQHLHSLQWKNRILLLFAANASNPDFTQQLSSISTHTAAFEDRDLRVFTITGMTAAETELRTHFHTGSNAFTLILIGKDGTEKLRKLHAIPTADILALIDSMPMRQAGGR